MFNDDENETRNVFISFRFADGHTYKEKLAGLFKGKQDTVDFSEDKDRRGMSEETIKEYLYGKLARSSVTIILLTPMAIVYKRDAFGKIDDWLYDEVRYSLEDREGNRTNGLVAVYTPEAEHILLHQSKHKCSRCEGYDVTLIKNQNNLFRLNMMNVKTKYKKQKCPDVYDSDYDSYCSLVSFEEFFSAPSKFIGIAFEKHLHVDRYEIVKRIL